MDKISGSLLAFYIGDALAMPVHWYYNLTQLRSDFGRIEKFEAPKSSFRGSIMNLSNTGGGGRGSDEGDIVGSVILHDKKKYWLRGGNYHYHHGMLAGQNTLDALITRVVTRSLTDCGTLNPEDFRAQYIQFMMTPGTHNDTYAGTCHRMFFKNLVNGVPPAQCPDNDSHNVDAIDALMIVPPVVLALHSSSTADVFAAVDKAIRVTRNIQMTSPYAQLYASMLLGVLQGKTLPEVAIAAAEKLRIDLPAMVRRQEGRGDPMCACYITDSFPAMLYFCYKYGDDVQAMLLASTNAGGENVARGSLLGALGGARVGVSGLPPALVQGLHDREAIMSEIEAFQSRFASAPSL